MYERECPQFPHYTDSNQFLRKKEYVYVNAKFGEAIASKAFFIYVGNFCKFDNFDSEKWYDKF